MFRLRPYCFIHFFKSIIMDVETRGNVFGSFVPARYIFTILGSIGLSIIYGMKVNLSMAMVGMLNHTALKLIKSEDENFKNFTNDAIHESDPDDGPFVWSSDVQGIILSSYYWGYICSQIPAGRVAELTSAKWVLFSSVAITAVCTMISPMMAEIHYMALMSMRILEGIGGGFSCPALNVLLSKWAPPAERSFMAAIVYSGSTFGTVISMLTTGILTAKAGWQSSFYMASGFSTIWCLLWVVLVQDSPRKQSLISAQERNMIILSQGGNVANCQHNEKLSVPWRAVFTSPAFLGLLVAHFGCSWGWFMLITEAPFYMKQVFNLNLSENTLYVAPPYFTLGIFAIVLSKTLDWLRGRGTITTTTARKIGTSCATVTASVCLVTLCFIGDNCIAAVITMAVAVTFLGGQNCGVLANYIDIAPNFAGTLFALSNTVATIPGIVVPIFASAVTRDNPTIEAWRIVFLVTVGIYTVETISFLTFGTGEVQPWNNVIADKDEVEKMPLNDNEKETDVQ